MTLWLQTCISQNHLIHLWINVLNLQYGHFQNERCRHDSSMNGASCRRYRNIKKEDEKMLELALSQIGPISVAINVQSSFHFYKKGKSFVKSFAGDLLYVNLQELVAL